VGGVASEEIILQLIKSKCLPILLYCLEICQLTKNDLNSLDFVINRFFTKLFKTFDINIVKPVNRYSLLINPASSLRNMPKTKKIKEGL